MAAASPARVETSLETKSITVVWKIGDVSDRVAATAAPSIVEIGTKDPEWCSVYLVAHYAASELGNDGKYRRSESPAVKCELFDAQENLVFNKRSEEQSLECRFPHRRGLGLDEVAQARRCSIQGAYKTFFENEQASDVRFLIGQEGSPRRLLRANKAFLSKRSEYYRSMFSSDFSEGASGNIDSEDRPNKRRKVERSSGPSPSPEAGSAPSAWQDDDDSLEWLPQEWLEEHGPQDVKEEPVEGGEADEGVIKVTDAGYITYRAMLYFLYTERITFTPSASNFTVALAANETNNQSRRAYLLSKSQGGDGDVEPASPHAVYRLADKLDMGELKELARDAIVSGFTAENILYELISSFAYHYDGIQKAALDFAWKNWDAVKSTPAFARVLAGASDIEGGSTILAKLVMGTTVAKAG